MAFCSGDARPRVSPSSDGGLELWGGHECTVNRVGDRFFDQTVRTGHQHRIEDLTRFAEIGFKALRYPVLWERVAPDQPDERDWAWTDERLNEIRRLGMRPIAGLVHHGSGPRYTHLLDPGFATGLAEHARATAERYPWIEAWTPVNEPLTTARFSALYGHWYPHAREEGAFYAALLNQVEAVKLSMRAIREVIPNARLVQTDDLGHTFATSPLEHQAAHDNERRWLSWDLLTGRLSPDDMMWRRIELFGLGERLREIVDEPCPPDVIGVNYYLSSERFLDHRADRYPPHRRGGNERDMYADVEAVRAVAPGPMGVERLLEITWERYGLPIAITECHNGCTRDEQMRWLYETWQAASHVRARGVPVEAVTVWSLLGSVDWNRLLTVEAGHYETGVFDVRAGAARPTAMVELCRKLAHGETPDLPALNGRGWWARDIRYEFEPVWMHDAPTRRRWAHPQAQSRPLLITGATGTLGRAFARACEHRDIPFVLTDRRELSLDDPGSVASALERFEPWAVVNTAGWVRVDDAEAEREACLRANAHGVQVLADQCATRDTPLLTFSSDLVFDGKAGRPYVETDEPSPLNVYGESKRLAERAVLDSGARGLVVRTAAFFSPLDPYNFAHHVVQKLSQGLPVEAAGDCVVSPTYVPDLVDASLDLLIDGATGVWHLANGGAVSWSEFAGQIAALLGLDPSLIIAAPSKLMKWAAARPAYAALSSERGQMLPSLEHAIERFAGHVRPNLRVAPVKPRVAAVRSTRRPETGEIRSFSPGKSAQRSKALDA